MKYSHYVLISAMVIFTIAISGCTVNLGFGGTSQGPDGGIFKTINKGDAWQQKALIPTVSGRPGLINTLDASVLAIDPSDARALYFGTVDSGLYYSYDAAESWLPASSLGAVTISALAVDPQDKCAIYAAIDNRVMKSVDCNRTWQQVYFDNQLDVTIPNIAIDHYDSHNVYLATSRGEVIASSDFGKSWRTLNRFNDKVKKVMVAPADSRIIFAATVSKGVFRSNDKGKTWQDLSESLKDFPNSNSVRDFYISKTQPGFVILANDYGLLKSINYGDDWTSIKLITPTKEGVINSVIVSEQDVKQIFYITDTTFYSTADGGVNWTTRKLPSTRAGQVLLADPNNANIIYLGVKTIKQ